MFDRDFGWAMGEYPRSGNYCNRARINWMAIGLLGVLHTGGTVFGSDCFAHSGVPLLDPFLDSIQRTSEVDITVCQFLLVWSWLRFWYQFWYPAIRTKCGLCLGSAIEQFSANSAKLIEYYSNLSFRLWPRRGALRCIFRGIGSWLLLPRDAIL